MSLNVIYRHLGKNGPKVPALGFGAMGLSATYGKPQTDDVSREVVKAAVEKGCTLIDTADVYGNGHNETLIGELLKDSSFRSQVFICTKFALAFEGGQLQVRGTADYVRKACEASLKRLQTDHIDLYYQHRVDRSIPIEETWKELKKLQEEGKVKHLGISEATAEEIRKAHTVAPISALQIEFSPWTPDIRENGILDTCRELGISIVAYSPLGRGFLTGSIKTLDDLPQDDWRRMIPRFQGEAFKQNLKIVDALGELADKKGVTSSQLTLAWVLAQGDDFITIPGTTSIKNLTSNCASRDVKFAPEELKEIEDVIGRHDSVGNRYPAGMNMGGF